MIKFEKLSLQNFVVYTDVVLEFSTDPKKPMTILRGENESGKTTMMRAFVWALYGTEALPNIPGAKNLVRPVWAAPGETIRTRVEIRFRSEREDRIAAYKLSRTVETIDDGITASFSSPEIVSLLRREGDDWHKEDESKIDTLRRRYFRESMRDFYFIDADKAQEFVGGPEGRHDDKMMQASTTSAVEGLLGLEFMRSTLERLNECRTELARSMAKHSDNVLQRDHGKQLEEKTAALETLQRDASTADEQITQLEHQQNRLNDDLRRVLAEVEGAQAGLTRLSQISEQWTGHKQRQSDLISGLVGKLHDEKLYAALMLPALAKSVKHLEPLKDSGHIPPAELTLLPRVLDRGTCVCGVELDSARRNYLESTLRDASSNEPSFRFLDYVLERSRQLGNAALGAGGSHTWVETVRELGAELHELTPTLNNLEEEKKRLEKDCKAQGLGSEEFKEKQKQLLAIQSQLDRLKENKNINEAKVEALNSEIRSLREKIRTSAKTESRTLELRNSIQAAEDLTELIQAAYQAVESDQVQDVARAMNSLFRDVITATDNSLYSEVGIRSKLSPRQRKVYEPYALDGGREKPLALANGASRRAIAVSFVLALSEQTGALVPLVADSLLHAMSGSVKRKIVSYVSAGDRIGQPIIFVTRDDVREPEIQEIIKQRAGASYTLTLQTHAGGEVIRSTPNAKSKQVVICRCEVDQFCSACERRGDRTSSLNGPVASEVLV